VSVPVQVIAYILVFLKNLFTVMCDVWVVICQLMMERLKMTYCQTLPTWYSVSCGQIWHLSIW